MNLLHITSVALVIAALGANASSLSMSSLESDLVPSPVEYAVLTPDSTGASDLPLVIDLHGGGGNRNRLKREQPLYDAMWRSERLPPMVFVMPSVTERGFYMDFKDGSERWETFIIGPFLEHLRATLPVSKDSKRTFLLGISMGGMGGLRIAFKHPEQFGAVAALEPGIEPILRWEDMRPKHRFWRADDLFERAFGKPVDAGFWAANNPATIAQRDPNRLRESGLQILIDAGDEDQFWLYEGAEFLHRVLWDGKVPHDYHLIRGADHVGSSLDRRLQDAVLFFARTLQPEEELPIAMRLVERNLDRQKAKLTERDHYSQ
jgi:S-formylglutathione hydrolase